MQASGAGVVGHVIGHGLQSGAGKAHACGQSAFHLDVKPALNRARNKLVRHHINQQPRHQSDQGKNTRKLEQQLAAKTPIFEPEGQSQPAAQQHQQQHASHQHIGTKQPVVVALVSQAVIGCQCQQKQQQHTHHDHQRHTCAHCPAGGT